MEDRRWHGQHLARADGRAALAVRVMVFPVKDRPVLTDWLAVTSLTTAPAVTQAGGLAKWSVGLEVCEPRRELALA